MRTHRLFWLSFIKKIISFNVIAEFNVYNNRKPYCVNNNPQIKFSLILINIIWKFKAIRNKRKTKCRSTSRITKRKLNRKLKIKINFIYLKCSSEFWWNELKKEKTHSYKMKYELSVLNNILSFSYYFVYELINCKFDCVSLFIQFKPRNLFSDNVYMCNLNNAIINILQI